MKSLQRKSSAGEVSGTDSYPECQGWAFFVHALPFKTAKREKKKRETMGDKTRDFLLCSVIHFL